MCSDHAKWAQRCFDIYSPRSIQICMRVILFSVDINISHVREGELAVFYVGAICIAYSCLELVLIIIILE